MRRLLLAVVILLSGCNLFLDNPLSDPSQDPIDRALIGTWSWSAEKDSGFVHIGTSADRRTHHITMVEFKIDGTTETTELTGHATLLNAHRFLNLKWVRPHASQTGYYFVAYAVKEDVLEVSLPDAEVAAKAIVAGTLSGEVSPPSAVIPTVRIRSGQNDVRAFVAENERTLFRDRSQLKKMVPASAAPRRAPAAGDRVP